MPTTTPASRAAKQQPRTCGRSISAVSQILALGAGAHPRCGTTSPARFTTPTALHLLWDDWVKGTERRFVITLWFKPESSTRFSFGASLSTLGLTTAVAVASIDGGLAWTVDWDSYVTTRGCSKLVFCDRAAVGGPRREEAVLVQDTIQDVYPITEFVSAAVSSRKVAFGLASERFGGRNQWLGGVDIPVGDKLGAKPKPWFLPLMGWQAFVRVDYLLGEFFLVYIQLPKSGLSLGSVVEVTLMRLDMGEGSDTGHGDTSIKVPVIKQCFSSIVRMRKHSGEYTFITVWRTGGAAELQEGRLGVPFENLKWLNTTCLDVTALSENLFCLLSPSGYSCEIWDCNDTSKPLKVIQLVSPDSRIQQQISKLMGHSGFLFDIVGNKVNVIDSFTEFTVLSLDIPSAGNLRREILGVWSSLTATSVAL
ncbi:hypothetical protein Pelo_3895 [Pelomyxa schiedti]|nr:hypothetical protein Pelo_3895 [Pelomyxa schiedti]